MNDVYLDVIKTLWNVKYINNLKVDTLTLLFVTTLVKNVKHDHPTPAEVLIVSCLRHLPHTDKIITYILVTSH